jgi:hypothetical protein
MFTYSDLAGIQALTILIIIWISIILVFQFNWDITSAIIHMCLMSVMTPITAPSFGETFEFALSVVVVDTRRVLRARETTARGVYLHICPHMFMPFSCGTKDSDYSISDSLEPDLKILSIILHYILHSTLYLHRYALIYTWSKLPVHVNLTSPHTGAGWFRSAEISPQR